LTGEFTGWQVSEVKPRREVLKSNDGQSLALKLQVHDVAIKQPPKPPPAKTAQAEVGKKADEDREPLSRAEQIRQRIAERREELRLEQEAQQAQSNEQSEGGNRRAAPSAYQNAIRNMMNNKSKDQGSNDKKDG
jgi:hypothetical protein